jgi:hypothetical protein
VIEEAKKNAKISREIPINQVADLSMLKGPRRKLAKKSNSKLSTCYSQINELTCD